MGFKSLHQGIQVFTSGHSSLESIGLLMIKKGNKSLLFIELFIIKRKKSLKFIGFFINKRIKSQRVF